MHHRSKVHRRRKIPFNSRLHEPQGITPFVPSTNYAASLTVLQLWDLRVETSPVATYKVHEFLRLKVRSQLILVAYYTPILHRNSWVKSIQISEPPFGSIKGKMIIFQKKMLLVCWCCSCRSCTPTTTFSTGSAAAPARTGPTSLLDLTGFYY